MTKFTKILTGVSLLALTAGNAHALDITLGSQSAATPPPNSVIQVPVALADEADETTHGVLSSTYGLALGTLSSTGFATNQDLLLTIDLTNGTFTTAVTGDAVTSSTGNSANVDSSSIQFSGGAATGLQGSTSVTFLVSLDASGDEVSIDLPITFDGCAAGDLGISATLTTDGGLSIEEGTVSLAAPAVTCVNAYEASISSDESTGDTKLTSLSNFEDFDNTVTGPNVDRTPTGSPMPVGNDTTTTANLGTLVVEYNPDGYMGTIVDDLSNLNPVNGDEVASATFDVTYSTPTGIVSSFIGTNAPVVVNSGTGTATLSTTVPDIGANNYIDNIGVVVDGTTQIAQQTPITSDHLIDFVTTGNLIADEAGTTSTLDDLDFQGATCGIFDWIGDQRSATNTLWRVTGHGDQVSQVFATLTEINNQGFTAGVAATDTVDITSEVVGLGQPEILITNQQIAAVRPNFGRADVSFNFIGGLETTLDCDRLQSGGTFTPFGNDDANSDGDD